MANIVSGAASPLLPLFVYFLGGGAKEVGTLASVASFVGVVASLVWGNLSDRTSRRLPFVLASFLGLVFCYGLLPVAGNVQHLIALNALISMFWMASAAVSALIIMESFPEADWEREIGQFNLYAGLGWTGGLALGAGWTAMMLPLVGEGWGLRSLGAVIALLSALAVALAVLWLREPKSHLPARSFRGLWTATTNFLFERFRYGPSYLYHLLSPRQILRFLQGRTALGPDLVLSYYGVLLASMGFSTFFVPLPIFLRAELGWPNWLVYAGFYIVHNLVSAFSYALARRGVDLWGHRPALAFALLIRTLGFGAFAWVEMGAVGWAVPILAVFTGASWSFYQLSVVAIVSRLAPQGLRGQALGGYNALSGLGNMFGALAGGFLTDYLGFTAATLAGAALVFLAMPILLVEGRPIKGGG